MLLHPKTKQLLMNIEKYYKDDMTKYYCEKIRIGEAEEKKPGQTKGFPYWTKYKTFLPVEQIKNGKFIEIMNMREQTQKYWIATNLLPIYKNIKMSHKLGKIIFFFTIENTEYGMKINKLKIKKE
jgi:hypothetical protein